jgi:hypothetical protein
MAKEIEGRPHLALMIGWLVGWHHDQEISKDSQLTLHFIVSVVQGPELVKLCSVTELCKSRLRLHRPKRPSAVEALSLLWPYTVQLQLCIMVCCLW